MSVSLTHSPSIASLPPCLFSCRIVKIDFYLTAPNKDLDICYSQFRSSAVQKVPIIRIFGSTSAGQKTCLHLHGVFPYLYVPCDGGNANEGYLQQLAVSIDHALQVSLGVGSKPGQHVFKVVLVKGIPFYGYHQTEELFLKIYLYNPMFIKRLSDLLLAGAVMNCCFQPHEAHIPFPLQFMIDYNLYGMNYLHLAAVKFRIVGEEAPACTTPHSSQSHTSLQSPLSPSPHMSLLYNPSQTHWNVHTLSGDMVLSLPRLSVCELEVDALAADILNRHELSLVSGGYPGLAAIWEEERQRRDMLNIDLPLSPPPSPERCSQFVHKAEARFKSKFDQIVQEKLGESDSISPEEETSLPLEDTSLNCTQSCDPELHRPITTENDVIAENSETDQKMGVVVDEVAVVQSMEMSQRLSTDAICNSTDAELMDLILDLCQTPLNLTQRSQMSRPHPLSQSLYCSQTVGQSLVNKMERTHSVVSGKSLFSSSPSPITSSPKRTEHSDQSKRAVTHSPYNNNSFDSSSIKNKEDTSLSCRDIQSSQHDSLDKRAITPVQSMNVSRIGTILDSSLDTSMDEPLDALEDQMFSGRQTSQPPVSVIDSENKLVINPETTDPLTQAVLTVERADTIGKPRSVSTTPTQSSVTNARAVKDSEPNLVSDIDLVIPTSPLTSPPPLSPQSKELQSLLAETFHSSQSNEGVSTELESTDPKYSGSEFDIPCAQVPHSQSRDEAASSQKEFGLSDVDPTWNPVSWYTSDSQSPFKYSRSGSKAGMGLGHNIQLEYDMPEIETSNYGVSDDSMIQSFGSDSYGSQSQSKMETIEDEEHPSQLPVGNIRRRLLKLCTTPDCGDCEVGDSVHVVEDVAGDSGDSEVEESFWMSQQVWDDIDKQSDEMSLPNFEVGLPTSTSMMTKEAEVADEASERENFIPQLDGGGGSPAGRRQKSPKEKVIKRKKTLGLKRRQSAKRPLPQSSPQASAVISTLQSDVSVDVTSKKQSEKGDTLTSLRKQVSSSDSKEKPRLSLSLNKGLSSKTTKDKLPTSEEKNSVKENSRFDKKTVEQALSCSFTLELAKLPFTMPAHLASASPQATMEASFDKHSQQHRRKRSRKEDIPELSNKKQKKAKPELKRKKYQTRSSTKAVSLKMDGPLESTEDLTDLTDEQQLRLAIDQSLKHHESQSSSVETIECAKKAVEAKKLETSPTLFSPRSDSAITDLDLDRTIIEESPFREVVERFSDNGSHDELEENSKEKPVVEQDKEVCNLLEGAEKECDSKLFDLNTSFKDADNVYNNGELDTSICSISESPPFTSSPIGLTFELCIDTDTNPSSIGSPIHTSSQDKTRDDLKKSPTNDPATTSATMETAPGGPYVQLEIPKLQNLAKEKLGFSAPQHLASPAKLGDGSMDTSDSHCSQGSSEGLTGILEDFHLVVSSESEGELAHEEDVQLEKEDQLQLSIGQEPISSRVTLKSESYKRASVPVEQDSSTVAAAGISEGVNGFVQEKRNLSVGCESMEDDIQVEDRVKTTKLSGELATCDSLKEDNMPQLPMESFNIKPSFDRNVPMDTSECISAIRPDSSTLAAKSILNRVPSDIKQSSDVVIVTPALAPPTTQCLLETLSSYGLPLARHTQPFHSNPDDTQRPKEIGGRTLRIASKMPYDLKEFHVSYSKDSSSDNAQFSMTGLQQMRVVLSMLSSSYQGTQQSLPPLCHPTCHNTNRLRYYSADDHKKDVILKSSFFGNGQVVITPAIPPPSPVKIRSALRNLTKPETVSPDDNESNPISLLNQTHASDTKTDVNIDNSSHLSKRVDDLVPSESSSQGQTNSFSQSPAAESPGIFKSDSSPDNTSVRSDVDDSITSYQVPRYVHSSTPITTSNMCEVGEAGGVCEGVRDGDGPGERERLTPVRKNDTRIIKNSRKRHQLPFTPIPSHPKRETSQLEGPTPNNTYGFKISQSVLPGNCDNHQVQYLTTMSVEVHVRTRGNLKPDPEMDPILAIFYFIHNDWPSSNSAHPFKDNTRLGIIAVNITDQTSRTNHKHGTFDLLQQLHKNVTHNDSILTKGQRSPDHGGKADSLVGKQQNTDHSNSPANGGGDKEGQSVDGYLANCGISTDVEIIYVSSELDLLDKLVFLVRETDPDILIGYEVTMLSWGYCIERAAHLNVNLTNKLSRMPNFTGGRQQVQTDQDRSWWGNSPGVQVLGRIMLTVWRLMRHEVALNVYSFENVFYHILHQRLPLFSFKTLTSWYDQSTKLFRYRVIEHYLRRCQGNFQLVESLNLIGRTSEFARLYGIEFENVIDRGTQYRVESMMLRLAKPANYIAVSPSVQQRARMAAPEWIPLILEPESKFYADPVLVLDFQSLYPSMVIAYNYCYSTCLGKVQNLALFGDYTFGATSLTLPSHVLKKLRDQVHISPNGVVFVKSHVRQGIMPTMLKEILGTRIMVKSSMKQHKANRALNRMLDARQMGLKLIANVTYGYTAANFSGRMPCVEIADSIVRKGRETLERAIELVNSTPEWGGRVVYGDTDSLFVLLKGASKEEAFRIGKEITDRVTRDNPTPVKLKFEKVYMPCILQTKKRYVGFMYETLDQSEPVFDAKGIETVRRDGCPAVGKILEKSLRILFTSRDLSQVKNYVQRQCSKLLDGRVNLQDYTFAKEYRGKQYYRPGACVPALELAKRGLLDDKRSEPRTSERVPYVVVYGTPGQPLIQLVRRPDELLENSGLRLNGVYYITKQILPALDRAFSLLGVDVRQWYNEMPRVFRAPAPIAEASKRPRGTIGQYFATMHCTVCDQLTTEGVCTQCKQDPQRVAISLCVKIHDAEKCYHDLCSLCTSCVGSQDPVHYGKCISLDCPVLYKRTRANLDLSSSESMRTLLHNSLPQIPW